MYETKGLDLDSVLKRYSTMVQRVAHSIKATLPPNVEVQDLIQTGLEGLMDAQRNYKPATGVPFEAYASMKVRWFIMDELRRQDWIPKALRDKCKALDKAIAGVVSLSRDGRVTEEQIAAAMEMDNAD
jgi:RNA polymerase sigma factor for flagellar operon FliA